MKITQLPQSERPYEKLELYGEKTLSIAELLAIIIKTGTKEETSIQLAQKILALNKNEQKQGIEFINDLTIEELKQIKGIGRVKAIQIKAACELAKRISKPINYKRLRVTNPKEVAKLFFSEMQYEKQEKVKTLILNIKNEILKIHEVATGKAGFVNVSIKDILVEPIKMQAPKMILVHNHPSGDASPSKQDIEFTKTLYKATQLFQIELLDHLVIGNMEYTSIFSKIM